MPEGHKTHYLAIQHHDLLAGQTVRVSSPQGRFRGDARKVSGRVFESVNAVGKHLFYQFEGNRIVQVHLGRYGKFRVHGAPPPKPVGQIRMRLAGPQSTLDLTGPTTCRVIDPDQQQAIVEKLGPDPLAGGRKSEVWDNLRHSRKAIGALLLDQAVIAGVGNIFRAEVLFETSLDPTVTGQQLSRESFDRLWRSLTKMMKTGLRYGRIISVTAREAGKPLAQVEGDDRFRIYRKTDCPRCGQAISTIQLAARRLYVCEGCQTARR